MKTTSGKREREKQEFSTCNVRQAAVRVGVAVENEVAAGIGATGITIVVIGLTQRHMYMVASYTGFPLTKRSSNATDDS